MPEHPREPQFNGMSHVYINVDLMGIVDFAFDTQGWKRGRGIETF
jgi:hypothetical protein